MTNYNLFPGTTPSLVANADGATNLSTEFYVTATGWVTQIRYLQGHGAAVSTATRTAAIYAGNGDNTGTLVYGPVTMPTPSGTDVWITYDLATAYQLTANQRYRVVIFHSDGGYPATSHHFDSSHTDGILVAPAASSVVGSMQGAYKYDVSVNWPNNTFNNTAYYSDVTVTDVNPNPGINPAGIASAEAFGTAVVTPGTLTVSPSGIASAEAFGTASITAPITISPSGIASSEAFGSHFIIKTLAVSPSGIASDEAFGSASTLSTLTVTPSGVATGEAFGTAVITAQGGATQTVDVTSGIASTEAFGALTVHTSLEVDPAGIPSAQAMGTPTLGSTLVLSPAGIASSETFGAAALTVTVYTVAPAGIPSGLAFGMAVLSGGLQGHLTAGGSLSGRRWKASIPQKE